MKKLMEAINDIMHDTFTEKERFYLYEYEEYINNLSVWGMDQEDIEDFEKDFKDIDTKQVIIVDRVPIEEATFETSLEQAIKTGTDNNRKRLNKLIGALDTEAKRQLEELF